MSLVRLLTAGKSLVGIQDAESRYRVGNKRLLPKFGQRNPFRAAMRPAGSGEGRAAGSAGLSASPAAETATPRDSSAAAATENAPAVVTVPGARMTGARRWRVRLAEFLRRKPRPNRNAIPRFDKPAVQGELSLETVKVVRNDLSDSDLLIVAARTSVGKVSATRPTAPPGPPQKAGAAEATTNLI